MGDLTPTDEPRPEAMEQRADGTWQRSCPEPLWVGFMGRAAQCSCGERFHGKHARTKYEQHWRGCLSAQVFGA